MAEEKKINTIAEAEKELSEALSAVKEALDQEKLDSYNASMKKLEDTVAAYNKIYTAQQYIEIGKSGSPIYNAVKTFYIKVKKVDEIKDKDTAAITDVRLKENSIRIDLERFCKACGLSTDWLDDVEKLRDLLCLREVKTFNTQLSKLKNVSSYYATKFAEKKAGGTPDSNRQIVALLQKIIDNTIFVNNGTDHNDIKVTSHDLMFIHHCIGKLNAKEKCTIELIKPRQFVSVMLSVFAHMLGERYVMKTPKSK